MTEHLCLMFLLWIIRRAIDFSGLMNVWQKGALTSEKLLGKISVVLGYHLLVSTLKRSIDRVSWHSLYFLLHSR